MTPDLKRLVEAITEIDIGGALREVPMSDQYDALMLREDGAEYIVRAVLAALREPSRATIDAARVYVEGEYPQEWPVMPAQRKEVLTAMIDHILDEPATA